MNENDKQAEPVGEVVEEKMAPWCPPHASVKWFKTDFDIGTKFYTHPAQPVAPAVAVDWGLLRNFWKSKGSFNLDELEAVLRTAITKAPPAAINEQMLDALKKLIACPAISEGDILNPEFGCEESAESVRYAEAAIAEAEKAKGGAA